MTDTPDLLLSLPLPPKELHAHAKGNWRAKSRATIRRRELAHAEALARQPASFAKGVLHLKFWWPDNKARDTLNAVQGIKPYIDGIVDAGVLPDDRWQCMSIGSVESDIDREDPRVDICIKPR